MPQMVNQKGISALAAILIVVILLALGGSGFFIYKQKQSRNLPPSTSFEYVSLNEDIVTFLFNYIPRLYNRIAKLNNELTLIAGELERIDELENQYPSGKRIIADEKALWMSLQKDLNHTLLSARNEAERFYIAYMVNNQKGKELIDENLDALVADIDETLETSTGETRRLKTVSNQTFVERLKGLF